MRAGRKIVAPKRIQQILVARECQCRVQLPLVLGERIFGEGAAHLIHHAGFYLFQRDVGQGRQLAREIAVDHDPPARHSWRYPAQNVSPVRQPRIGDGANDHPFVFRSDWKETGNELLGLGRV